MILKISNTLSRDISIKCSKIKAWHQSEIDEFIKNDKSFSEIINNIKLILEENLYITVKNIGFVRERNIFEAFVKQFGNYYGDVEYTDIKIDCPYTGCNYNRINFHNDDAIDLQTQPTYGFIQVINEDPLKITQNYIVKIDEIIDYLEVANQELLDKLFNYKVPMLSYGVNYLGKDKQEIILKEPIFYQNNENIFVRFDFTRIKHFYWKKDIKQSIEEKKLIFEFLETCNRLKKEIYLEKSDIFIHNNKRCLHDRGDCSMELNEDGTFNTREIFVSFVR